MKGEGEAGAQEEGWDRKQERAEHIKEGWSERGRWREQTDKLEEGWRERVSESAEGERIDFLSWHKSWLSPDPAAQGWVLDLRLRKQMRQGCPL